MNTQLTPHNSLRFSLTSCATEDSADSASVATPLDVSPCPQRNNIFPIINPTEHESPYLTRFQIPDVAAVVGRHRHRQHGALSPLPRSIRIVQTQDLSPPSQLLTNTVDHTAQQQQRHRQQQQQQQLQHHQRQERQERQKQPSSSQEHPEQQRIHHHSLFAWPRVKRILPRSSSSSSSSSSTNQHQQHMRKKPSSSRGVMSHLSSLVCNSMRLANSMTAIDQQRQQDYQQQQKSAWQLSSSSSSPPRHLTGLPSQKKKATQLSTTRWFGKNKSRISPHQPPLP